MKRFFSVAAIVMMAIAVFSVSAYAGGGLKSGFMAGFTSSSSNAKGMNADNIGLYHVGLTVKFPVAFGFAIQPAVLYQTKGTKLSDANIDNFKRYIAERFCGNAAGDGIVSIDLTPEQIAEIEAIEAGYLDPDFLSGRNHAFAVSRKGKIAEIGRASCRERV